MASLQGRLAWKLRRMLAKRVLGPEVDHDNFFRADNVAIFPELRLIFNRIKKSGNTSITAALNEIATGPTFHSSTALKNARLLQSTKPSHIVRLRSYRSLVVSRDPYTRALSGFLEKVGSGTNEMYSGHAGFGDSSSAGFEAFLRQLIEVEYGTDRHFWPQTHLLFQPLSAFTFRARLETIVDDMRSILEELDLDPSLSKLFGRPHEIEAREAGKITGSAGKAEMISPDARRLVDLLYSVDFDAFGYSRQ